MNAIDWLERWYEEACDGEWEHEYGIRIESIDNPGWRVEIDLRFTELESMNSDYQLIERSENDWYGYQVKDAKYVGVGDPGKLTLLIAKFKELVEGALATHSTGA